jgi:thioredoxin-related protein
VIASAHADFFSTVQSNKTRYVPVTKYDPKRDAVKDIQDAIAEAKRSGKRILLEVGGEWCLWCHRMDHYFEGNPKLLELREQHFITVKINFSTENENKKLLSACPEIPGYPHIFVLDADGKLLHSQNTGELEAGKSYDLEKFIGFLKKWSADHAGLR